MEAFRHSSADGPPPREALHENFVSRLPVDGASISAVSATGSTAIVSSSDDLAARLEQLQFDLGEGPRFRALRLARPVLISDVQTADRSEWPMFAHAITQTRARAVFSFPMRLGAAVVGVADLYRLTPGMLSDVDIMVGAMVARAVAERALALAAKDAVSEAEETAQVFPGIRRHVHQAVGMVAVQLDTTATDALARLRAHAFAANRSLDDVARDVVARVLDFTVPPPTGGTDGQQ